MRPTIKSYEEAALFLGQSNERGTGQRGTKILRLTPTEIAVRYHNTDVVIYHHPQIVGKVATIDSGGWNSPTTMNRINEYAPFGLLVQQNPLQELVLLDAVNNRIFTLGLGAPYTMARQHSFNWAKLAGSGR